MYHFKDLKFISDGTRQSKATLTFKNGYGCIVLRWSPNTNFGNQYEFIQTLNDKPYYHSQINDGPVGYCTPEDIEELMFEVQSLKYA